MIVKRLEDGSIVGEYGDGDVLVKSFDPGSWPKWRKVAVRSATRMTGPFTVETSEGPLTCEDGYLAHDARGYPYPIAAEEFSRIYVEEPAPVDVATLHPATAELLRYFAWEHLPAVLQVVSRPFGELAHRVAAAGQGPETTTALRKLLEAKDCAVRAALPPAPAYPLIPRDESA